MKKQSQNEPDIAGLMARIQEQIAALEKKMDILLSRPAARPAEARPLPQPSSPQVVHAHPDISSGARLDVPRKERPMFQAVCADCKKDCEVPFKPTGDRPVYCKECFQRRKSSRTLNVGAENRPLGAPAVPVIAPAAAKVPQPAAKARKKTAAAKKPAGKKKPAARKKK